MNKPEKSCGSRTQNLLCPEWVFRMGIHSINAPASRLIVFVAFIIQAVLAVAGEKIYTGRLPPTTPSELLRAPKEPVASPLKNCDLEVHARVEDQSRYSSRRRPARGSDEQKRFFLLECEQENSNIDRNNRDDQSFYEKQRTDWLRAIEKMEPAAAERLRTFYQEEEQAKKIADLLYSHAIKYSNRRADERLLLDNSHLLIGKVLINILSLENRSDATHLLARYGSAPVYITDVPPTEPILRGQPFIVIGEITGTTNVKPYGQRQIPVVTWISGVDCKLEGGRTSQCLPFMALQNMLDK
jgi:hypothetical protein